MLYIYSVRKTNPSVRNTRISRRFVRFTTAPELVLLSGKVFAETRALGTKYCIVSSFVFVLVFIFVHPRFGESLRIYIFGGFYFQNVICMF